MASAKRPTSGLRRDLGTLESYAVIVGILIGAGIFKVTGEAWLLTGSSVILGYLILAPAVLATSVAYSVFLSTPLGLEPGGEYLHISRTFRGHGLAFVGAWLKIISYTGALAYLAVAFADYTRQLWPGAPALPVAIAILLFFYVIHVAGVRWFGRLQVWMCAVLGVSILVLVVPGMFAMDPANYRPFFTHGMSGFVAALPPLFFAYAGFESLAQAAGEVKDSTRQLPRIFTRGIIATTIIYLLMSAVSRGVFPGLIVSIGALMAITTSLNATMLVPSRIGIVLTEDGLTPRWLGSVSPRTGTPIVGLTITLAGALALLLTNQIGLALNIAVFALVLLYFLHSLALLVLPRSNPDLYRSITAPIPLTMQRAAAVLSMIAMAALLTQMSLPTVRLLLFWALVGALFYAVAHRRTARRKEDAEDAKLA
jgi:APA family basic amino acid/polyamine antiporter